MSRLSDLLQTGRTALRIQQLAMQIVGHNTANVNTEGFSRRQIELATAPPYDTMGSWTGGVGVDVQELGRVRDRLIDEQIRRAGGDFGYWTERDDQLQRVEEIFSELGGSAISDQLQEFWSAWQDLANEPEGMSARYALIEKTQALTSSVQRVYDGLVERRGIIDGQVVTSVNEVNELTAQIAGLNTEIVRIELSGQEASDLRDTRDLAVDRLSKLLNISIQENQDGSVNVYNGGQILVQLDDSIELQTTTVADPRGTRTLITYGSGGRIVDPNSGDIKALLDLRDKDITGMMDDLDTFATSLASRVNSVHQTGYGLTGTNGLEFFAPDVTGAADFRLSSMIVEDPSRIATAASAGAPGDNSIALQIAGIQNEKFMSNGQSTLDAYYRNFVLSVGAAKSHSASQLETEQAAMDSLENRRQQVSGVSMDDEMTRLMQVQQAYEAAAKMINTVDEMMQTVLSLGSVQ